MPRALARAPIERYLAEVSEAPSPIERLHRAIDAATAPLVERHAGRLACRKGCAGCCVDDISVYAVEAELIRRHHPDVLAEAPHPEGACAFLDGDGGCRVYPHRPYVCRTQGLPIRWHEEQNGELVELRDICALNEDGEPLIELAPSDCWTLGAAEDHLTRIQGERGSMQRVRLRDLFAKRPIVAR